MKNASAPWCAGGRFRAGEECQINLEWLMIQKEHLSKLTGKKVIIKTDSKELIIKNPQVSKIKNKDMDMYQVMGNDTEEIATESPDYSEDDILLVMQQAQVSKEQAIEALTDCNGDLAQAILKLTT